MTTQRNEILFIDANVLNAQSLIAGISPDVKVVLLDNKTNAINQIAAALDGRQNLDAIHIISHGTASELTFANGSLNNANVDDYATQLKRIGSALSANGDLLLYGCDVAKGDAGLAFINQLSFLTGADVAASDDLTGNSFAGANWVLESTVGSVEADAVVVNDVAGFGNNTLATAGIITTNVTTQAGLSNSEGRSVTVQADGKILVAGTVLNGVTRDFALVRYNSDGSLDLNFGTNGKITTAIGIAASGYSAAIQVDGKILVTGTTNNGSNDDFALVRYNANGSLDTSFDNDGKVATPVGSSDDYGKSVTVQADGKILVAGSSNNDFALVRYNTNGSLDTSFDNDGVVTTNLSLWSGIVRSMDSGQSITMQADGKILVAGYSSINGNSTFALTRYNSNGSLDLSFDNDGIVTGSNDGYGQSVTIQADGKILVAGHSYNGSNQDFALARYNSNGSLDLSFDNDGIVTTDIGSSSDFGYSVIVQADGKILVAGSSDTNFALTRYNSNGSLDLSFGTNGKVTTTNGLAASGYSAAIQADGKILVTGSSVPVSDWNLTVARYNSDGSLDTTFTGNHAPSGNVNISGTAQQNQTLTASNTLADLDGLGTISYQWMRSGSVISGAIQTTYTTTASDVNANISVTASYADGLGKLESVPSSATTAVANVNDLPTGSVTINGTVKQGETLTANTSAIRDLDNLDSFGNTNNLGTINYQWWNNGTPVVGATAPTYTLTQADVGKAMKVVVSYTDTFSTLETLTSNSTSAVVNVNDPPTPSIDAITISGTPTQYQTLTAETTTLADADGLGTLNYQWFSNGAAVGANQTSYLLTQADVGKVISFRASYTDLQNTPESVTSSNVTIANVNDLPIGSVTISGSAIQNQVLTASNSLADLDGLGVINYQWFSNGTAVGSNQASYLLTQTDVSKTISVKVSYTDGFGTLENVPSNSTSAVANVNDSPTGSVTINGTLRQGEILTADTSAVRDLDNLDIYGNSNNLGVMSYKWLKNGNVISGATQSNYTATASDTNASISVIASYTDNFGAFETITSSGVVIQPLPPIYALSIDKNTVNENETATLTLQTTNVAANTAVNFTLSGNATTADVSGYFPVAFTVGADGRATLPITFLEDRLVEGTESMTFSLVNDSSKTATVSINDQPPTYTLSVDKSIVNESDTVNLNLQTTNVAANATVNFNFTGSATAADIVGNYIPTFFTVGADGKATISLTFLADKLLEGTENLTFSLMNDWTKSASINIINDTSIPTPQTPPTGGITISSLAQETQILTATSTLQDVNDLGTFNYQWLRAGSPISGATQSTYTLSVADVNKTVNVQVSYTDGLGKLESVVSNSTAPVTAYHPADVGTVVVSGRAEENQILAATNNFVDSHGIKDNLVSYQWLRNGVSISGVTQNTYTLKQADVGKTISVTASYTDGLGKVENRTSNLTAPVANINDLPTGSISISGTPTQGQILTASNSLADLDGLGSISYQWFSNDSLISGATASTYKLTQAEVNKVIKVMASYTDSFSTRESVISSATAPVANVNDLPTGSVSITGIPTQGQTLTASNSLADLDGLGSINYQWLSNGAAISGATQADYTLTTAEIGKAITVKASYLDLQNTTESKTSDATALIAGLPSAPTGSVTISGTAQQNQTLTASNNLADANGLGTISYSWLSNGISVSNLPTYTLTQNDVGKAISVTASYTDGLRKLESVSSSATALVANVNDLPSGFVAISGTAAKNQMLTAINNFADLDGLGSISYQWFSNNTAIPNATAMTYKLTPNEVDKKIKVVANYTDGFGTLETLTSDSTIAVVGSQLPPTGKVLVNSAPPEQNQTLTVSPNTLADANGLGKITYQWLSNGVPMNGKTQTTYTLTQADVGKTLSVSAGYLDGLDKLETVISNAVVITNVNDDPRGAVAITGTPEQNQMLSATNTLSDLDGLGKINYQWFSNGTAIPDATAATYTLTQAEVGKIIKVLASYTDGFGKLESVTSKSTATVTNVNDAPTGSVLINGLPTQGQILTASNSLADLDSIGLISYQWLSDGKIISGKTGDTYALMKGDINKNISVIASYTDGFGKVENVASSTSLIQSLPPTYALVVDKNIVNEGDTAMLSLQTTNLAANSVVNFTFSGSATAADVSEGIPTSFTVGVNGEASLPLTFLKDKLLEGVENLTVTLSADTSKSATISVINDTSIPDASYTLSVDKSNVNEGDTATITLQTTNVAKDTMVNFKFGGTISNDDVSGGLPKLPFIVDANGKASMSLTFEKDKTTEDNENLTVTLTNDSKQGVSVLVNDTSRTLDHQPTGKLTINGKAEVGQTLNFTSTLKDVDGLGDFSYQWLSANKEIKGATRDSYTLTKNDVGNKITLKISYTDGLGDVDTKISSPATNIVQDLKFNGIIKIGTPNRDKFIGEGLNDSFSGMAGNDELIGEAGNDLLDGGAGNDKLDGGNGNDSLIAGLGNDTLSAGSGNDSLDGGAGNDKLVGDKGKDTLQGGLGVDNMNGGAGDDYYFVDNVKDVVTETDKIVITGGKDTVESTSTYTLGKNIEDLMLAGINDNNGTGNDGNNQITGNVGDNYLNGGAGNDKLIGGKGTDTLDGGKGRDTLSGGEEDDIYIVNNLDDKIIETAKGGEQDQIMSTVNYDLGTTSNVEFLTLSGTKAVTGMGNELNNLLQEQEGGKVAVDLNGGAGNDTLIGGSDNDTLQGGEGNDSIDGGDGKGDLVIFDDEMKYYDLTYNPDTEGVDEIEVKYVRILHNGEVDEGDDILTNVEFLQFADGEKRNIRDIPITADSSAALILTGVETINEV